MTFVYMSVSPFVSGGKQIEINKNEEESDDNEIEEKSHIKSARPIKSRELLRKEVTKLVKTQVLYLSGTHQAYMLPQTVAWHMKPICKKRKN